MNRLHRTPFRHPRRWAAVVAAAAAGVSAAGQQVLTPGNLVVAVEGCGIRGGTCVVTNGTGTGLLNSSNGGYGDNQAAPITLFQYAPVGTTVATYVNALVLPQTATGPNLPVSGEYGSSSEGTLQLSTSGRFLAVMGYGIPAATFDANPANYGAAPSLALAQSGSLTGQSYTPVARVAALIDGNGNVDSATAVYNIFNTNNPRSIFTANGTTAYLSGQGSGSDATGGLFFVPLDTTTNAPTPITGLDTTNNTISQDTRDVQIVNNTLYTSVDTKGGSNAARDFVGTVGTPGTLPRGTVGAPNMLNGYGTTAANGKVTITTGPGSNGNAFNAGQQINLSPNSFFFAAPNVLYVADGGHPKNNSATSSLGDGGLQKWINTAADGSGTWNLAYTLYKGLGLVANTAPAGSTGLYGLAGAVVNGTAVNLYATDYTLNDLDTTHLYGVTDTLGYTTAAQAAAETFTLLDTAPSDSNFKGVSFAPTVPGRTVPTVTWPAETAVSFGSALSSQQLNATANIPGTLSYTPAAGTVPAAGPQILSVTFTPTDTADYTTATVTNNLTVTPSTSTGTSLVTTDLLSRSGGSLLVQVTVANTGNTAAAAVQLTGVKVGSAQGVTTPVLLGALAAGKTAVVTVTVPGTAGASGGGAVVAVTGSYSGGSFGGSSRVVLP